MAGTSNKQSEASANWKWVGGWLATQLAIYVPWAFNQVQSARAGQPIISPPTTALILTCVTTIGAALGKFGVKVWKELEKDAVRGTANMLRAAPGMARDVLGRCWDAVFGTLARWVKLGGFTRRYLAELRYKHGLFNDKGLGLINANRLDLDKVYVEVKASADFQHKQPNFNPVSREIRERAPVWDHLRTLRPGFALVLIGAPGCGKTTLLQHVLLTFANNRQWQRRMRARVPFFIELRKVLKELPAKGELALPKLLEKMLKQDRQTAEIAKSLPKGWLEKVLQSSKCILLWDGLDEVADPGDRAKVAAWLDGMINHPKWRKNISIVTARPAGYQGVPLDRAQVLEVQPFAFEDTRRFIRQWYHATEVVSSGNRDDQTVRRRAADETQALIDALHDNPRLGDLTSNPLLLTMICMVHRYHGALPGSRGQLYAEICQVLLERWRQQRGVTDRHSGLQKLEVLRPLAARMMEQQVKDIGVNDLLGVIADPLSRIGISPGRDAAIAFLKQLQESSGLLLERELGIWGFAHLSFQEFLCADEWINHLENRPSDWGTRVAESWWRETLLLYASRVADAGPLVTAALDANSSPSLALVMQLQSEKINIDVATRERVEAAVAASLGSRDEAVFRAAGEAWLQHQQQANYHRLDEGRQISGFVTQAEFQLFWMTKPELVHQFTHLPANWKDAWFKRTAREPVLGVSGEMARAYCDWLDERFTSLRHRLPVPSECEGSTEWMTWCFEGGIRLRGEHPELIAKVTPWLNFLPERHIFSEIVNSLITMECVYDNTEFNLEFAISIARALGLDLGLDLALDLDLARALALDVDRALALGLELTRDLRLARALALALARDLDLGRALALARARGRALGRVLDLGRALDPALDPALDFDLDPALDLARALARVRTPAPARALARALARARDLARARARDLVRDHDQYLDLGLVSIESALQSTKHLPSASGRRARCLLALLPLFRPSSSLISLSSAYRRFWVACFDAIREHDPRLITKDMAASERLMRVLVAREDGILPGWEGIRIVRESRI